jgi:hypothetical protein
LCEFKKIYLILKKKAAKRKRLKTFCNIFPSLELAGWLAEHLQLVELFCRIG